MTKVREQLRVGTVVQTLYTPPQTGRSVCPQTGAVGRITERDGEFWTVRFPRPLILSDSSFFLHDEEHEDIGVNYRGCELRRAFGTGPQCGTIVAIFPHERGRVATYDVSRWEKLGDGGYGELKFHEVTAECELLKVYGDEHDVRLAMYDALWDTCTNGHLVYNWKQVYHLYEDTLTSFIWEAQCRLMDEERDFKQKLEKKKRAEGKGDPWLEGQLLVNNELGYSFMHCHDAAEGKEGKSIEHELALVRGRIESLESIAYQLRSEYLDRALYRLARYYRAQSLMQDWCHVLREKMSSS
jgi:hypothetical protein